MKFGSAINYGRSLSECADAVDQETYDAAHIVDALQDGDDVAGNEVGEAMEIGQGQPLYVSSLRVDERYRGLGLGLLLLWQAANVATDHMSLVFFQPYPLRGDAAEDDASATRAAHSKLVRHFRLIGMKPLKKSGGAIEYVGQWTGAVQPHIWNVCPHLFPGRK